MQRITYQSRLVDFFVIPRHRQYVMTVQTVWIVDLASVSHEEPYVIIGI